MTTVRPSASNSIIVRLEIANKPGMLGRITTVIGQAGGDIGAIDIVGFTDGQIVRDISVNTRDEAHEREIESRLARERERQAPLI